MNLLSFDYASHHFVVVVDAEQKLVRLEVNGNEVSNRPLDVVSMHEFEHPELGSMGADFVFDLHSQQTRYQLFQGNALVANGVVDLNDEAIVSLGSGDVATLQVAPKEPPKRSIILLLGIGIKLFKTLKVLKVALAAASVAVYSVMFTFEFALALVGVLVFHEYGHLRAMKKFGIPTKGMYLIPFFGGIALGDKPRTQWEDLYISMMGPIYGLFMTAVFYVIYLITDSHFCGLVASTSALLNLVNMLPVYPLDGGRVIKALVFSRRNYLALVLLLSISALCLVITWNLGLHFLAFFVVLGVLDIVFGWSVPLSEDITPLKTYGIWVGLIWYFVVTLAFLAMILLIAQAELPGSEIALKILQS